MRTVTGAGGKVASTTHPLAKHQWPVGAHAANEWDGRPPAVELLRNSGDRSEAEGRLRQSQTSTDPYGHWQTFAYDCRGRVIKVVSQFGDNPVGSDEDQNRVVTTTYSLGVPSLTQVETCQGLEVRRHYEARFGDNGSEVHEIEATKPGAAWDDPSTLVTITKYGVGRAGMPEPVSVRRPDGTLALTAFAPHDAAGNLAITTSEGEPSAGGLSIVNGLQTVTKYHPAGQTLERTTTALQNLVPLALTHVTYDYQAADGTSLGFATGSDRTVTTHEDGTTEITERGCCGPLTVTDRAGTVTTYTYDEAGRVATEARDGLTMVHTYDAEGREIKTVRRGTDQSEITLATTNFNPLGQMDSTTEPPVNDGTVRRTTLYVEAIVNGHRTRTATAPDGGTRVETYYQDGTLYSLTGSAVAPVRYEYGAVPVVQGATVTNCFYTKEIKLDANGQDTPEWACTYTDGQGREVRHESPREVAVGGTAAWDSFYFAGTAAAGSIGQLARTVDPDGVTTLFTYNGRGEREFTAIDMNGNGQIDLAGPDRVTKVSHTYATRAAGGGEVAVEQQLTQIWQTDGANTPTDADLEETSPNGDYKWSTQFGLASNVATVRAGNGQTTETATAPDGSEEVRSLTNGRLVSRSTYASDGTLLSKETRTYDTHNRVQSQVDQRNGSTDYTWYTDGTLHTVTLPAADTQSPQQVTSYAYGPNGARVSETQPDNGVVNSTYWPTGALKRTWGARTYPVEYTYDAQGRLQTLKTWRDFTHQEAGAALTTWIYDAASGSLARKQYADGHGPSYSYTPGGRLQSRTWARGVVTNYGYDSAGNVSRISYSDATPAVTLTPDRLGRPHQVTDAAGTRVLTYNAASQLLQEDFGQTGLFPGVTLATGYDGFLRRASLSGAHGAAGLYSFTYSYDAASRLASVTSGADTASYTYVPLAPQLLSQIDFQHQGNSTPSLTTQKAYDFLSRLQSTATTTSASGQSVVLSSYAYTYNSANQRTTGTLADGSSWTYQYDGLGQVTSGVKSVPVGNTSQPALGAQFGYTYDTIGNRTSTTVNGRSANYTANALNQYTSRDVPGVIDVCGEAAATATVTVNQQPTSRQGNSFYQALPAPNTTEPFAGNISVLATRPNAGPNQETVVSQQTRSAFLPRTPETLTYDADGNLKSDGQWTYDWDAENQLVGMSSAAGLPESAPKLRLEFTYDYLHRRVQKAVFNADATGRFPSNPTRLVRFLYDHLNLSAEIADSLSIIHSFGWGVSEDGAVGADGGIGGLLFVDNAAGEAWAPMYDGNENVVSLLNLDRETVDARYEYGPYGDRVRSEGSCAELNPFRWSATFMDVDTQLVYYINRYYDCSTGRWLSRDPVDEVGGLNLYDSASNDAIDNYDILGFATSNHFAQFEGDIQIVLKRIQKNNEIGKLNTPVGPILRTVSEHYSYTVDYVPTECRCTLHPEEYADMAPGQYGAKPRLTETQDAPAKQIGLSVSDVTKFVAPEEWATLHKFANAKLTFGFTTHHLAYDVRVGKGVCQGKGTMCFTVDLSVTGWAEGSLSAVGTIKAGLGYADRWLHKDFDLFTIQLGSGVGSTVAHQTVCVPCRKCK